MKCYHEREWGHTELYDSVQNKQFIVLVGNHTYAFKEAKMTHTKI